MSASVQIPAESKMRYQAQTGKFGLYLYGMPLTQAATDSPPLRIAALTPGFGENMVDMLPNHQTLSLYASRLYARGLESIDVSRRSYLFC